MPSLDPNTDYPLGSRRPDLIATPSGMSIHDLTLEQLRAGVIAAEDVRATPETLRMQADIADSVNRSQLADNLRRAAELTGVPDDIILAVYTALRPGRSTSAALEDWAETLENEFEAPTVAAFIREALEVSVARGLIQ